MKLHQSKILSNIEKFKCNQGHRDNLMRDREGIFIVWKTIEYFNPKSMLEIGFGCGQTLGLMLESAGPECQKIVSNDIRFKKDALEQFNALFPNNIVEFIEKPSQKLTTFEQKFDFVAIDGDHSYLAAKADIEFCLPLLHENSILCIDDYWFDSINLAILDTLIGKSEFVPFLKSYQQIYFCHRDRSVEYFLDEWLIEVDTRFMQYTTVDYHGHNVTNAHLYDIMFIEDHELFCRALKFFNL